MTKSKPVRNALFLARVAAGLSQEELSKMVDMSQNNFGRKERNTRLLSIEEKQKISKVLNKESKELFPEDAQIYIAHNKEQVHNIQSISNNENVNVGSADIAESIVAQNKELMTLMATINNTFTDYNKIMLPVFTKCVELLSRVN